MKTFLLAAVTVAASACAATADAPAETCTLRFASGAELNEVPVAKTVSAHAKGLSGTDNVGVGMLFVWDAAEPRVFWMRDTRVALSIAFMNADGAIFDIQDMQPMSEKYHFSMEPAQYALEVPAGDFARLGLSIGDRLSSMECASVR